MNLSGERGRCLVSQERQDRVAGGVGPSHRGPQDWRPGGPGAELSPCPDLQSSVSSFVKWEQGALF